MEQIDEQDWGELRLRQTPLKDLTVSDLRLLVSQQIGLKTLVPKALHLILSEPLLEADFYPVTY